MSEPEPDYEPDGECITCAEGTGEPYECPQSLRQCGHHCNHSWSQDICHWCGEEWTFEEEAGQEDQASEEAVPVAEREQ